MKKDQGFHNFVMSDVFKNTSGVTSRAMFGGWGIYQNGVMFALIADGELYFKVGETNKSDFEKEGSHPFVYSQGNHKSTTMSYWVLPERVMEDEEELAIWVKKSVSIARKAKKR